MSVLHHRAVRVLTFATCLGFGATQVSAAVAQEVPAAPATTTTTSVATTTPSTEVTADEGLEEHATPAELGITSAEVGPAEADESAQAVPYTGTQRVWCTQSNPSPGICKGHHGYPAVDLGMVTGTTVYASGPGVVQEARSTDSDARGVYVVIRHPDGIYSRYLHMSSVSVNVGDTVTTGTPIGRSGNSGSSSAPHLHYDEQRPYGTPKELGDMAGVVGTNLVTYPAALGSSSWRTVPFNTAMRNDGYRTPIPVTPHQWGSPATTTGDFDADGYDDVATGVPGKDTGTGTSVTYDPGAVTVIYGSADGPTTVGSQQLSPGANGLVGNAETGDTFGAAVAAGDFNGDRYDDLAVGVPREDTEGGADTGAIIVIPGSADGLVPTGGRQRWSGTAGTLPGRAVAGDQLGAALAAGDFDLDGRDDLAIGVPGEDAGAADAGAVIIARGTANGLSGAGGRQLISGRNGLAGISQVGDLMGAALATGDLDGDGDDDLAIGCPGQDIGRAANAGQVIAVAGSPTGLEALASIQVRSGVNAMTGAAERDDVFGAALAAGNVTGDGTADLVVGVPGEDAGAVNDGAIVVIPGSLSGLSGEGSVQYWSGSRGSAGTPVTQDLLGASLAIGDVDGDEQAEILVGIPGKNVGNARDAGAILVIGTTDRMITANTADVAGTAEATDRLGRSVAAGDLNGDGIADLVATAPTEAANRAQTTGAVLTILGARLPASAEAAGLTGSSVEYVRGMSGLAGVAKKGDQFGGLLPPYLF